MFLFVNLYRFELLLFFYVSDFELYVIYVLKVRYNVMKMFLCNEVCSYQINVPTNYIKARILNSLRVLLSISVL